MANPTVGLNGKVYRPAVYDEEGNLVTPEQAADTDVLKLTDKNGTVTLYSVGMSAGLDWSLAPFTIEKA